MTATEDGSAYRASLVEGSSFAHGVLYHSITNSFVVSLIPERDPGDGNHKGMSSCVWNAVCEIVNGAHDGSVPAVEIKEFVVQIDDL